MIQRPSPDTPSYLSGLGNALWSEAIEGALPRHQNSPRKVACGLYPEQINGTAFTVRRAENARAWLYRVRPSVSHSPFTPLPHQGHLTNDFSNALASPELMRWRPLPFPDAPTDFLAGLHTVGGAGDPTMRDGLAVHVFAATADMGDAAFYNSDGDLLIAPETGALLLLTEYGKLLVGPGQFAVIPRGIKFNASLPDGPARGYVLEVYNGHFKLPERGPIGANGLADERHFMAPTAWFEDRSDARFRLITKFGGRLFEATQDHSPFDVVAWHGNYYPYLYDLTHFNAMGTVTFDHPDPSILTVLTVPRDDHGNAVADVIFFPGRWDVAEHTFRPPYLHRNAALEFSGIIKGPTDSPSGYSQGVFSATPGMTAHGIHADSFNRALDMDDAQAETPTRIPDDSLWIMFESTLVMKFTPWALDTELRDADFRRIHASYHSRFHHAET